MPSADQLFIFIPLLALSIPIVAIIGGIASKVMKDLTQHQQRMAELLHQRNLGGEAAIAAELRAMRQEIADLRDRVNQGALVADDGLRAALESGQGENSERVQL